MKDSVIYLPFGWEHTPENLALLAQCQAVRRAVFVEGQGVPEAVDFDGNDECSAHLLILKDTEAIATARIRKTDRGTKLERIAVLPAYRGTGLGEHIVRCGISLIDEGLYIHAQMASLGFYTRLGFVQEHAEIFYEADIPHTAMIYPHPKKEYPCQIIRR